MPEHSGSAFLESALSSPCPSNWEGLRKSALEQIRTTQLPTTRHEDWKYLDLSPVYSQQFSSASDTGQAPPAECQVDETCHSRLVFVNGVWDPKQSDISGLPGEIQFSLLDAANHVAAKYLGGLADPKKSDVFANINTARFADAALIHIPSGHTLETTALHLVFQTSGAKRGRLPVTFPRLLVVLEPGAKAHLVEEYHGTESYLTTSVIEIALGEGAALRHDRIQRESEEAYHFCTLLAQLETSASYTSTTVSLGSSLSRQNTSVALTGDGAELELNGLCVIGASQTADTHSIIDHSAQNCTSRQLQKFVIDGKAHGVFNGQIKVRAGIQQTNAIQSSRNLLLSDSARIDTKPQLEIFADDVKCSHGATIGQLNAEEMFYLQSRGLDLEAARNLLLTGFASEVLERLGLPSLRHALRQHAIL